MIFYSQSTGLWTLADGSKLDIAPCISGNNEVGKDLNNPDSQCIHNHGPLPRGVYMRGLLGYQTSVKSQGCYLSPDPANEMCGRSGFFLHLRNHSHVAPDGTNASSDGCITFGSLADLVKFCNVNQEMCFTVSK